MFQPPVFSTSTFRIFLFSTSNIPPRSYSNPFFSFYQFVQSFIWRLHGTIDPAYLEEEANEILNTRNQNIWTKANKTKNSFLIGMLSFTMDFTTFYVLNNWKCLKIKAYDFFKYCTEERALTLRKNILNFILLKSKINTSCNWASCTIYTVDSCSWGNMQYASLCILGNRVWFLRLATIHPLCVYNFLVGLVIRMLQSLLFSTSAWCNQQWQNCRQYCTRKS